MTMQTIIWLVLLFLRMKMGVATTFSSVNDPGNPDNRCYCTNKVLKDKDLVVAHPKLPCGSRVLIYAPRTRRSVVATVQDRGPRHAALDMSEGTTRALRANGMENILFVSLDK